MNINNKSILTSVHILLQDGIKLKKLYWHFTKKKVEEALRGKKRNKCFCFSPKRPVETQKGFLLDTQNLFKNIIKSNELVFLSKTGEDQSYFSVPNTLCFSKYKVKKKKRELNANYSRLMVWNQSSIITSLARLYI